MTDTDLDRGYTALCRTLGELGEDRSALFLATLSLHLLARCSDGDAAVAAVEFARRRCLAQPGHGDA